MTAWSISAPVCRPNVHIRMSLVVYCLKLDVKHASRRDVNCLMKLKGVRIIRWIFCVQCYFIAF